MILVLLVSLAETPYGLEIDSVQEIVEDPQRHFVPRAEGVLQHAINVHGNILPVIDLPQLLGFGAGSRDHRLVVLTSDYHSLALAVSRVGRIIPLDPALLEPVPAEAQPQAARGVFSHDERQVFMLDLYELLRRLKQTYTEEGGTSWP